jgi:hypothetical protein
MRRCFLFPIVILLAGCGNEMKEFSPDGSFTVLMPGSPKYESQQVLGMTTETYGVEERGGFYALEITDYGANHKLKPEEIDGRLVARCETLLTTYKARLTSEEKIKLGGNHPGSLVEAELTEREGVLKARVYFVKNRMYQLVAVGSRKWASSENVKRFLESLKVKE